jgi:hypothetical protein
VEEHTHDTNKSGGGDSPGSDNRRVLFWKSRERGAVTMELIHPHSNLTSDLRG